MPGSAEVITVPSPVALWHVVPWHALTFTHSRLPHPRLPHPRHIAPMPLLQQTLSHGWSQLLGGLLIGVLICAAGEVSVRAQSAWETGESDPWSRQAPAARENESSQNSGTPASAPASVPDWAAPSNPTAAPRWSDAGPVSDAPQAPQMNTQPPSSPNKAPLSGLEWLLLAGAGYGAHRLRKGTGDGSANGCSDT
jgi:hypothetical protein